MPPGIPGNPAKDVQSSGMVLGTWNLQDGLKTTMHTYRGSQGLLQPGDGRCGPFSTEDALRPYAVCPLPPAMAGDADVTVRECCRHMAYAIPYPVRGFFAWAARCPLARLIYMWVGG